MDALAIVGPKAAEGRAAQSQRLVQYRLEYGSEIAGRSVNHSQHLGGCCLLFHCLVMLGFALGKFSLTLGKLALRFRSSGERAAIGATFRLERRDEGWNRPTADLQCISQADRVRRRTFAIGIAVRALRRLAGLTRSGMLSGIALLRSPTNSLGSMVECVQAVALNSGPRPSAQQTW
jgi:hypothetical protein